MDETYFCGEIGLSCCVLIPRQVCCYKCKLYGDCTSRCSQKGIDRCKKLNKISKQPKCT